MAGITDALRQGAAIFAQYFQQQHQEKVGKGQQAKMRAQERVNRIDALFSNPDATFTEAQRANLEVLRKSYEDILNADDLEAEGLFMGLPDLTTLEDVTFQKNVMDPSGKRVGGREGRTLEAQGDPLTDITQRTVTEQREVSQAPTVFLANLEAEAARDSRARTETREDQVFTMDQLAKMQLAEFNGTLQRDLATFAAENQMDLADAQLAYNRERDQANLSAQEQLTFYTTAREAVAEMVAGNWSATEIAQYVAGTPLSASYKRLLMGLGNAGKIVNVGEDLTDPSKAAIIAGNLNGAWNAAMGRFDTHKLSPELAAWVEENPGAARSLAKREETALAGMAVGLSREQAALTHDLLSNTGLSVDIQQGRLNLELGERDRDRLDEELGQMKFTNSQDRINAVLETGSAALYAKLSESEREAVDTSLAQAGTSLGERSTAFITNLQALQRQTVLNNTATELGIDLTQTQVDANTYAQNRARMLDPIQDATTIGTNALNAAKAGAVETLMIYQSAIDNPEAYPELAQSLKAAGLTRFRVDNLIRVAQAARQDDVNVADYNQKIRDLTLRQAQVGVAGAEESHLRALAETFEDPEEVDTFFAGDPAFQRTFGAVGQARIRQIVGYNKVLGDRAMAAREVEAMIQHRPEDPASWDGALFTQRFVDAGGSREVAEQVVRNLKDEWGRAGDIHASEIAKTRAMTSLYGAQASQALAAARDLNAQAATRGVQAETARLRAEAEVAQATLDQLKGNQDALEGVRATLRSESETLGCIQTIGSPDAAIAVSMANRQNEDQCARLSANMATVSIAMAEGRQVIGTIEDGLGRLQLGPQLPGAPGATGTPAPGAAPEASTLSDDAIVAEVAASFQSGSPLPASFQTLVQRYGQAGAHAMVQGHLDSQGPGTLFQPGSSASRLSEEQDGGTVFQPQPSSGGGRGGGR